MRVRCRSGLMGYRERLLGTKNKPTYVSFEEFKRYCGMFNIHGRLGYKTPESCWRANPMIEGSTDPNDFRKVRKQPVKTN